MELLIALVSYFLPAVIASCRGHHNQGAIFALNLLLGWTLLGWVAALVWSLTAVQAQAKVKVELTPDQVKKLEAQRDAISAVQ
jgi:T4 superinfection immunity protein